MRLSKTLLAAGMMMWFVATPARSQPASVMPPDGMPSPQPTFTAPLGAMPSATPPAASHQAESGLMENAANWAIAIALLIGAIALSAGVAQYRQQQRWKRIEFIRQLIHEFLSDESIQKVLKILDFEEFRKFPLDIPGRTQTLFFEPTDDRLCNALVPHDEALRHKQELEAMNDSYERRKAYTEYLIESELRDWFDVFLQQLGSFEYYLESRLIDAEELKPFINYWVRLIGDRRYRRIGGSAFYEQLFTYIHQSGYTGVQDLFERYGYRILPSPYLLTDFEPQEFCRSQTRSLLSLAKAAYLVYEDPSYIREIMAQKWGVDVNHEFFYLDDPLSETQAILFRKSRFFKLPRGTYRDLIVLSFRGTQQIKDWQTNINMAFCPFASLGSQAGFQVNPQGKVFQGHGYVHRGFQRGWQGIAQRVIEQIHRWDHESPNASLWISGHSLGGALATVAAAALEDQGVLVDGVATFGQPRVGDWTFVSRFNTALNAKTFRFVNNNDLVPDVPPIFVPWNLPRLYYHVGQLKYIDFKGKLLSALTPGRRFVDSIAGYLDSWKHPKLTLDGLSDHFMEHYIVALQNADEKEKSEMKDT
jgi:hypothetical protein